MVEAVQPANFPADTIVVTARALADPSSDGAYSIDRIDRDILIRIPRTQLDEVLKQVPGLQLFRRSDSRSGHPTSQGVTLRALGGNASSRALLVLDGVPQADPFGGWINWPAYDPLRLDQVKIVRGGGSVAFGPGALAGVIDMTSSLERGLAAALDAGSRESVEGRAGIAESVAGGTLLLAARGARGDGFIPITSETRGPADQRAGHETASARAQWVGPVTDSSELQISSSAFTDRRDRGLDFTDNRTDGLDASVRLVGRGQLQFAVLGYGQWREFESSFATVDAGRTTATRVSLQDSVPSHALGGSIEVRPPVAGSIELRLGTDTRRSVGESRELFSYVDGQPTRRRVAGGRSVTLGAFADATLSLDRLTINGGGRLDYWRVADGELREWLLVSGAPLRDDHFPGRSGWLPTARMGGVYDAGRGWSIRSAAYLGWRLPTLNELFRPFRAGLDATAANSELKPEKLRGVEIGIGYQRTGIALTLTAFDNRLKKAIANVTLGQGPGVFPGVGFVPSGGEFRQRRNLDAVTSRGIEASVAFKHGPWLARGGLSLVEARVQGDGSARQLDGLRPAQTPALSMTGAIGWEKGMRSFILSAVHNGAQYEDDLNLRRLAPATTIDALASWPLSKRLQLVVRGENLLDELVIVGIGGDGAVERATPRTIWMGLRLGGITE